MSTQIYGWRVISKVNTDSQIRIKSSCTNIFFFWIVIFLSYRVHRHTDFRFMDLVSKLIHIYIVGVMVTFQFLALKHVAFSVMVFIHAEFQLTDLAQKFTLIYNFGVKVMYKFFSSSLRFWFTVFTYIKTETGRRTHTHNSKEKPFYSLKCEFIKISRSMFWIIQLLNLLLYLKQSAKTFGFRKTWYFR